MFAIAEVLALRATCAKLKVGCVLVDSDFRIIGSGFNGVPRGIEHCIDNPCPGANAPSGSDLCEAVHAESNALLNCRHPENIYCCFCTHAPCLRCTKTLLNTGCEVIIYRDGDKIEMPARDLWLKAGKAWIQRRDL